FLSREALPLTPSGKVYRRALPSPEPERQQTYLAPRTPIEEMLAGIWSELLGLRQIGVTDNFFQLGGHSLIAMQFISRACKVFHIELPLHPFFEAPTVGALAERIGAARRASAGMEAPPLVPARVKGAGAPL